MIDEPNVLPLIALSKISMVTCDWGTVKTGADESAYTVIIYNLSPGPCEHGGV